MKAEHKKLRKISLKPKQVIVQYDRWILSCFIALCFIGLYMNINIGSVTEKTLSTFLKQLIWFGISSAALYFCFVFINMEVLKKFVPLLLAINLFLIILVLFKGRVAGGAIRSLSFRGVNFQPSLPMRVMLVLYFARFLEKKQDFLESSNIKGFLQHFKPLILISLITFAVVLKQRHFSVIVISAATLLSMLWIARIRLVTLVAIISLTLVAGIAVISFGPTYRGNRMAIYAKYSLFHRVAGRAVSSVAADDSQIKESLISLSQGGLTGTSSVFGQAKNRYLAESTTDYIYSVIGEEHGFIGAIFVFLLYTVIFYRGMLGSWKANSLFLKLTGIGLTLNIFYNALVNIGVAMSALPSTGVTLPFISYGGTSLLTNSICVGLLLNITAVRKARET